MEVKRLAGLEPASVFGYFEEICSIPHGSRNTKLISDYLVNFAKSHDLRYIQDDADNVIIFADATPGFEDHAPIILQGHMDMVCEQDADCTIDMTREGLDVTHDGNVVFAKGTTLGADNGTAVAIMMDILQRDDRIDSSEDYFYAVICDGMGQGRGAAFASSASIRFLKQMLEAKMSVETSLSVLNAWLRADREECSVSIDILQIDLLS